MRASSTLRSAATEDGCQNTEYTTFVQIGGNRARSRRKQNPAVRLYRIQHQRSVCRHTGFFQALQGGPNSRRGNVEVVAYLFGEREPLVIQQILPRSRRDF